MGARFRRFAAAAAAVLAYAGAVAARAQAAPSAAVQQAVDVTVQGPEPSIVKLGDAAVVTVSVATREKAQLLAPDPVPGMQIQIGQPSYAEYSTIQGGRISTSVELKWNVVLRPEKEGTFGIPRLRVKIGDKTVDTRAIQIEAVKDITGAQYAFLEVSKPPEQVFVHEPVRIKIRFGIDHQIRGNMVMLHRQLELQARIEAAWMTELPGTVQVAPAADAVPQKNSVTLALNQQAVQAASVEPVERKGRTFDVFEIERTFLPVRTGVIELGAPLLHFRYATKFDRDFFGDRVASNVQNAYVYGEAAKFTAVALPEQGKPADFSGGVGRFTLSADASPSQLKVGESLKLRLRIAGEGNLEFLEPPNLGSLEGFHVFGKIEDKDPRERVVTYDLSPLSETVKEIPPIQLHYFDTTPPGAYRTATTKAIPLRVQPLPPGAALTTLSGEEGKRAVAGVDDIFDMRSAAGAADWVPPAAPSGAAAGALLAAPAAVAGAAWLVMRRRERDLADPRRVRSKRAAARFAAAVAAPGADAVSAFADYLSDKLGCAPAAVVSPDLAARLQNAGADAALAERAARALDAGVAARYAGAGAAAAGADAFRALVADLETALKSEARP